MRGAAPEWVGGQWLAAQFWAQPSLWTDWKEGDILHCYCIILKLLVVSEPPYTRTVRTVV